jgi:hypothetical protein
VYVTQTPSGIASDAMFVLFVPVAIWAMIPGFVFQKPLFDPTEIGYSPHGLLGWLLLVAFWVVISLGISLLVQSFRRYAHSSRTI